MSEDINREVVRRHLDAWRRGDVPALLADYSDDAVMLSAASGPLAGKPAIGAMFAQVFETVFRPEDTTLDVTAEIAAGDTVLVHWTATTTAIRTVGGFDVFTMRDGKIAVQCGGAEIVARD